MPNNVKSMRDFKETKKAKLYIEHITAILHVLSLTIKGLEHFTVYGSVRRILIVLKEEQAILKAHLKNLQDQVNKGKDNE